MMSDPLRSKEWREFLDWCRERQLRALPAHGWTLASYALWCDANQRHRTIGKRMDVIVRVHLFRGLTPPDQSDILGRTLRAVERRRIARQKVSAGKVRPVFDGQDLLEPKKAGLSATTQDIPAPKKRSLRANPPLVSRRPDRL